MGNLPAYSTALAHVGDEGLLPCPKGPRTDRTGFALPDRLPTRFPGFGRRAPKAGAKKHAVWDDANRGKALRPHVTRASGNIATLWGLSPPSDRISLCMRAFPLSTQARLVDTGAYRLCRSGPSRPIRRRPHPGRPHRVAVADHVCGPHRRRGLGAH